VVNIFDDLQDLLGIKLSADQKIALKELARRKNDTLRVYNPLPYDQYVDWGLYDQIEPGGSFLIPGKNKDIGFGMGLSNQPRYIATKFFKECGLLILHSRQRTAIDAENIRRQKNGFAKMSKTVDNDEESQFLSIEGLIINHDSYLRLLPVIIKGIVHEWGLDQKPVQRFSRTLTLAELQEITDREIGTEPNLGSDINKEQLVPVERKVTTPNPEETLLSDMPTDTSSDPLAGISV
jgi:hypothetical protein